MSYKKKLPKRRSPKQNKRSPKQKKKKSPKQKKKKSPKQKKKSPKKRSRRRFSMKRHVINVVNDIMDNQELRLKLYKIYSKYAEKTATFGMIDRVMNRVGEISQDIYLRIIDTFLGNYLPSEVDINFIMDFVDVGVRIPGQERVSYSTFIINMLIFSISLTQNNQYYMMTPMFMSVISNFINNPGENDDFFNILLNARINGNLNPEDILYDIQTIGVPILNPEQYEGWYMIIAENVNRIGNRAVYTAITQALSLYRRRVLN